VFEFAQGFASPFDASSLSTPVPVHEKIPPETLARREQLFAGSFGATFVRLQRGNILARLIQLLHVPGQAGQGVARQRARFFEQAIIRAYP
jgi:hypothetical protein